jgi:hypothetical protein
MEGKVLKLIAQLGLVALVIWVIAAAMGKGGQFNTRKPLPKNRMNPRSIVWNQDPVIGPGSSSGLLWTPQVMVYGNRNL